MHKWGFCVLALALGACSRRDSARNVADGGRALVASTLADAGPAEHIYEAHGAHFEKGQMDQCLDARLHLAADFDAGPDLDPMAKTFASEPGMVRIKASCAEQFPDRPPLATCDEDDLEKDAGATVEIRESFYSFAAIGLSDSDMQTCLKEGGDWKAIPRTSPEFQRAKLDYDRANLRKMTGKLSDEPAP